MFRHRICVFQMLLPLAALTVCQSPTVRRARAAARDLDSLSLARQTGPPTHHQPSPLAALYDRTRRTSDRFTSARPDSDPAATSGPTGSTGSPPVRLGGLSTGITARGGGGGFIRRGGPGAWRRRPPSTRSRPEWAGPPPRSRGSPTASRPAGRPGPAQCG